MMGSFLDSIVKPTLRLRKGFFRFALIFPPIYVPVFFAMPELRNPVLFAMILPLHFLAMFCLFYGLYFVSKNLAMVESGKPSTFYDYAGPLFPIWFFPFGVWFTQPRINGLYSEHRRRGENSTVPVSL
jgi:hypothetical protein